MGRKRLWTLVVCVCLCVGFVAPAFAQRSMTVNDLKGIKPKRYRYLFSVFGGAAIGAGVGALLGGGNDITKGLLVGGGGASTAYLHTNRHANLNGWRPWAMLAGHTALGGGVGWTICGCNDGLLGGSLIGGGASAVWQASQPSGNRKTASTGQSGP